MKKKINYRDMAIDAVGWHIRCGCESLKDLVSDFHAGSIGCTDSHHYTMGGLYTTNLENPAKSIKIFHILKRKPVADFPIEEIYNDALNKNK